MIETEVQSEAIGREASQGMPARFDRDAEFTMLDVLVLVVERKRFIVRFVLAVAVLATVVAFLLPVRYEAKVVLLPPQQNSSIGAALTGQLGGALGALGALAGGGLLKNPADMYVSLLKSRTVEDGVIQRFGLQQEYHKRLISSTRKELERRITIEAGSKDGLIRLTLEDGNPQRAAELANGYVDQFRRLSASLAITEAARRRLFFEQQLQQAKADLTDAENAMSKTQQSTGVLQIDSQARALIESAAILRAEVVAKQVQIEAMRSFATDDNPNVVLAKQELTALQSQLERLAGSQHDDSADLNLSKGRVTAQGMEYLRRLRDLKYRETVFELLAKEFEIAKLDEAREGSIVQVVDMAVPPDKRAYPYRTLIVLGATIFAFFGAIFWVLQRKRSAYHWQAPENRQRLEALKRGWRSKRDII
jgi:uncharacterized protein involved in exopolysaccharide biosynthesis